MDEVAPVHGALGEAVVFLWFFDDVPGRHQQAEALYSLDEVLLLFLLAMLAGGVCRFARALGRFSCKLIGALWRDSFGLEGACDMQL